MRDHNCGSTDRDGQTDPLTETRARIESVSIDRVTLVNLHSAELAS